MTATKSEKEKMLGCKPYYPCDETLTNERMKCKVLCREYNNLLNEETNKRIELIKKIVGQTGKTFLIEQPFLCDYGYNICFGENFYSNHGLIILDPAKVTFGDNVFIGPNCGFYTANHPINPQERIKGIETALPITVGNNVWFGGNVVVLGGVTIGNNAVIGAGSVVARDIPDNVTAAGNPCKIMRKI